MTTILQDLRAAWPARETDAREAYALFITHCESNAPIRVPGMDTLYRLAIRLNNGRTIEEAAAREYVYRWHLAVQSHVFGVPHTIGL